MAVLLLLHVVVLAYTACATRDPLAQRPPVKFVLTPDEVREFVHERVPELEPEHVNVVFEVDEASVSRVRDAMRPSIESGDDLRQMVRLVTSERGLGLLYDRTSLGTAMETIAVGRGNCLSLAGVLVGVARSLGYSAGFAELSLRHDDLIYESGLAIDEEHMGVKLSNGRLTIYVDYSGRLSIRSRVRLVGDLRATAQYYSNYAYSLVHDTHADEVEVPWEEVARRFEIATRIEPSLAQAWNNLGVARGRLHDVTGAEQAYVRAIELVGNPSSAQRNLRRLHGLPPGPEPSARSPLDLFGEDLELWR